MPFKERIELRGNEKYFVSDDGDMCVLSEIYAERPGEAKSYGEFQPQPNWRILDIGANKGIFSIWAAKQGANVVAYEPNPSIFPILHRNLKLNNLLLEAHNVGVWHTVGKLPFYPCTYSSGGSSFIAASRNEFMQQVLEVPVVPFDSVIGNVSWDLVKMDVEGSEIEILLNSQNLSKIKRLTVEFHYWPNWEAAKLRIELREKLAEIFTDLGDIDGWTSQRGFMYHGLRKGLQC